MLTMIRLSHNAVTIVDVKVESSLIYTLFALSNLQKQLMDVYIRKENNERCEIGKWWAETTRYIRNLREKEVWLSIFFTINLSPLCVIQPHILLISVSRSSRTQLKKKYFKRLSLLFLFLLVLKKTHPHTFASV